MSRLTRSLRFGSLATVAALAAACGGGARPAAGGSTAASASNGARPKTFTIAMIAKSSTNPVFLAGRIGAEAAAAEQSKKLGIKIPIDWLTPPTEDAQVQAQRVAQAVDAGDNAILMSTSDANTVTDAINTAVARGVPVMMFDSDAPNSKRFSFYGGDDVAIGEQVMAELAKQMNGKGNVAILAGNQNAPNLQKRVQGVKEEAAKYPGIRILNTFYHKETPQDAAAEVMRAMNAYPNIQGWVMIGGWALWTKALLTTLDPAKVKVASVDALPASLAYITKGIAPVLLAQPTYDWGYVSVNTIVDHVLLHKAVPAHVQMDLIRVTRDNLGTYARQLVAWGFTDVDSTYLKLPK
ncbi:MAG: substrate-binding domain-containing protein [Gemmatimonadota bacterium]|nr:substrate-binding domain-containing protein [Gemmatimonadota bacterium]